MRQADANMGDPEQHCAWALEMMPTPAGQGAVTHPAFLRQWSAHLYAAGFRHVSAIAALADADGMIHVSQLPKQEIKLLPAIRGPRNRFNQSSRWVPVDTPDPPLLNLPDITELTTEEQEALLAQFRDAGKLPTLKVGPPLAGESE